jgi:hypothetical protein
VNNKVGKNSSEYIVASFVATIQNLPTYFYVKPWNISLFRLRFKPATSENKTDALLFVTIRSAISSAAIAQSAQGRVTGLKGRGLILSRCKIFSSSP